MEDFKTLLRVAIKPRTITQFSEDCGMTKQCIVKLLSGNTKPTMQMLKKFANNAWNDVTLNDMVKACGFDQLTKRAEIQLSTIKEMIEPKEFITTLKKSILESIYTLKTPVKSRGTYLKEVVDSTFAFPVSVEKTTSIMFAKNKVSMFVVSSEIGMSIRKFIVCVMFAQHTNGFFPINATTDTTDIIKMGFENTIRDMISSGEVAFKDGYNFFYSSHEIIQKENVSDPERLLREVLANKYKIGEKTIELEEIQMMETGFGFYISSKLTEKDFMDFAKKHISSLPVGVQEVFVGNKLCSSYISSFNPDLSGPEALILDILRTETGFAWVYNEKRKLRMFAIPTIATTDINKITLQGTVRRIAKDLSAERYGTVYWSFTFMEPFPEYPL